MLSKELSTHLTGRVVEIEILPFSYKESNLDFESFYKTSSFPDILINNQDSSLYLDGLKNSIIYKDIVNRYKIRNSSVIEAFFDIFISNPANLFTYQSLSKSVNLKSETSTRKYIDLLKEAYLIFDLLPFSYKTKSFHRAPKKSYLIDNGFMDLASNKFTPNNSMKLENFIFLELIKSGLRPNKEIFYYKTKNNYEIDFLIKDKLEIIKLIQVSYEMNNPYTKDREIRALLETKKELKTSNIELEIITWDLDEKIDEINIISIKKFLKNLI